MSAVKIFKHSKILFRILQHQGTISSVSSLQGYMIQRGLKNSKTYAPYLRELYQRQVEAGPQPEQHPSESGCWNYDSEMFAFGKRFQEDFDETLLRTAFTSSAYLEAEQENRKQLGIDTDSMPLLMEDNTNLAHKGEQIASRYIKAYLRKSYPMMFEEGIQAVHDFLMSDEMMSFIGSNMGIKDLILAPEYPPEESKYTVTLKALIGALAQSQSEERADLFVRDFILPQLIGRNLMEIWKIVNPMGLLCSVLSTQGRGPAEPRLLWQSASATMMSVYHVGIYSDKQLIGRSPGETVTIAEEMAARDALSKLMNVTLNTKPMQFGQTSENWKLDYERKNQSLNDLLQTMPDYQIEGHSSKS